MVDGTCQFLFHILTSMHLSFALRYLPKIPAMAANVWLIFGGASVRTNAYPSLDSIRELLDMLQEEMIGSIDTATSYLGAEELLGQVSASSNFEIDTNAPGVINEQPSTKERIMEDAAKSTKLLQTDQVFR